MNEPTQSEIFTELFTELNSKLGDLYAEFKVQATAIKP
jgi:hypothetical protein